MKSILIILVSLSTLFCIYFFVLGIKSQSGQAVGLVNNRLSACPNTPNCFCSEFPEQQGHYISPMTLRAEDKAETVMQNLKTILQSTGGIVILADHQYLAATYTSRIFRFIDDVEIRLDSENKLIHLRSASRVGHSDLGVNKKRLELIKSHYLDYSGNLPKH